MSAPLREALTAAYDGWLAARIPPGRAGVALAAVGSLGRREPSPWSDLDLVLLHTGRAGAVTELAESIWYPVWDSGIGLDHSVRTPDQAVDVARDDLKALLGLLDLRHVCGAADLTETVRSRVLDVWRAGAPKRIDALRAASQERWGLAGEGAFLLEPNLKESRGGLRDYRTLVALARAQLVDVHPVAREAAADLLDLRGELHRRVGRADDVLRLQEHDGVAADLGWFGPDGRPDRDLVLRQANRAARTIAHAVDLAFRRVEVPRPSRRRRLFGTQPGAVVVEREGIARDVVAQGGEVVLARDAAPRTDPAIVVRVARAAAEQELPIAAHTLDRLLAEVDHIPEPWPDEFRDDFVALLGTGRPAIPVLESLDLSGMLSRLIPEWDAVRSRAQHNPVHTFTVDRHLIETAAQAAEHTHDVHRPDLLLVGALLHDIGKGYPGDHSTVGAERARAIAARMGFGEGDVGTITALTRHHLLLPDTAVRRDPDDPATVRLVTHAVAGSGEVLDLLHALAIADAHATGPAAWSDWKAGLIADLVARARQALQGDTPAPRAPLDDERRALAEKGELAVVLRDREVIVAAPDGVGVLYRTAGILALHLLNIRQASIQTYAGMAVNVFAVEPRFGRLPDPAVFRADLARALAGEIALADRLREKERAYATGRSTSTRPRKPPVVEWFDDEATDATVLEIRAADSIGLLTRITAALERSGADIRSARVSSVGHAVLGAFYLTDRRGRPVTAAQRADIEVELRSI